MIVRQEADIAISRVTHTRERSKYVDFSYPYAMEEVTFATKEPDKVKVPSIFFFTEPFQIEIWIAIVAVLILVILIMKFIDHCSLYVPCDFDVRTLITILLRQDVSTKIFTRKALNLIALTTLIIMSGCTAKIYECMITSSTSIWSTSKPIDDLEDMVDAIQSRQFIVRAREGSSYYLYLLESRTGHMKILAESLKKNPFRGHPYNKESFSDILKNKITVVGPKIEIKYLFLDPICVVFQKKFQCKTLFNRWLTIFMTSGLLSRWEVKDLETSALNTPKEYSHSDSVGYIVFSDLFFIFCGLVVGWILAIFVWISEIFASNFNLWCRNEKHQHRNREKQYSTEKN